MKLHFQASRRAIVCHCCRSRAAWLPALALFVLGTMVPAVVAQDWVEMGPAPITSGPYTGRTSAVVASPTDADRYYVAGADGGVWRTLDGGRTWTPLMDDFPVMSIGALALDPADENTIYAGSGEANYANHCIYGLGLYKSTDGGDTWTQLAEETFGGRTFARLAVSPTNSQVVYAAIGHAGGFPARVAAKGHPGTDGPVGIFKSEDGGQTWSHLTNGVPAVAATDLVVDPTDGDVVYAAIGDIFGDPANGIYRSKNGGGKFKEIVDGLPNTTFGRISLGIAPSDGDRLYAMITRPSSPTGGGASTLGIYRSDNGGGLWTQISSGSIQATYGWYLSTIIVAPDAPGTAFFGGLSLIRTLDSGQSFANKTPPHVDMHGLAFDANGRLLCANDGGLHRSANLGDSWQAINDGLGVVQFYAGLSVHPIVRHFVLGGTQDNGTNRRDEDGLRWTQRQGGDGGYTAINPLQPNFVWAEFQGTGNLFRSANTGQSFSSRSSGINGSDRNCFLPPYTYDPQTPNRLLYATHRIYQSTNNGDTWAAVSGDLTGGSGAIRALAIAPSNSQTVYAATNNGRVLVSKDGGSSWNLQLEDIPGWPRVTRDIAVDPTDHKTAYLGVGWFGVDQVYETTDRGSSWQPIDGDLPDIPVNSVAVRRDGETRYIYAGTDNGVFVTENGGVNWTLLGTGLPNSPVFDVIVDSVHARVVAATQGRGAWYFPLQGLDCDAINKFKVKCKNGKLKGVLKSDLPQGTVVTFGNNDTDIQKLELNRKGKAKAIWTGQSGQREVCVGECQLCDADSCS